MADSDNDLRGFDSLSDAFLNPKKGGGKRGATTRGALNAAHRYLTKVGGSVGAVELAYHLIGLGFWTCDAKQPQNTIVVPLNNNFAQGGGMAKAGDAYDQKLGSFITKTAPGQFALRSGSPAPKKPDDADTANPAYIEQIVAGRFPDHFGVATKKK